MEAGQIRVGLFFLFFFRGVVCEAVDYGVGADMEGGRDSGGAGDIRDNWFAGQEASARKTRGAEGEIYFGSLFVEFCGVDSDSRGAGRAVGQGLVGAGELREVEIMRVVFVQNDDVRRHLKESGLGRNKIVNGGGVERGRDKIR